MPQLTFSSMAPALASNSDFKELMSLMEQPELKQKLDIPSLASPATTESPTKLNAGANSFVPSNETKEDKE